MSSYDAVTVPGQDAHPGTASRVITLIAVIVPLIGLVAAIALLWGQGVRTSDLLVLLALYVVPGLGITVGFHRYFTHKSFETSRPMRAVLAVLGCMTTQGPVSQWVSDHRRHHAHSDEAGDPHSPHIGHGAGVLGALRGFWHSHVGWLFSTKGLLVRTKYGRDLTADTQLHTIDRLYFVWVALGFAIPFAVGYAVAGIGGGLQGMIWGGLVRIALFQHVTWSVNSVCHMFGRRGYESRDESRNVWLLALPSLGEAWHNNHHAFPSSAVHGLDSRQVDVSGAVIRGLAKIGLVWDVKLPDAASRARRAVSAGVGVGAAEAPARVETLA